MSFPVAVQSALFYIIACTPCAKVRHRQKVKEEARKERQEKARLENEQPGLYRHPSPYNTNPYWQEEISMGPSLPKKSTSKNSSQRGLTSAGRESFAPNVSEHTNLGESRTQVADSSSAMGDTDALSDDWNRRHGYQREDEELWGQWSGHRLMDAFSKARGSAGRLIESTLRMEKEVTDQERREFYFSPKNPPINEYHPPSSAVSSHPGMPIDGCFQPPPPAKVMEGKIPVSRAGSSGSKSSARTLVGSEVHLGRLMQEKMVMEKLKKETSNPTETELIESLFMTRTNLSGNLTRTRSLSFDTSDDSADHTADRRTRGRLRPVAAPPGMASDDSDNDEPIVSPQNTLNLTLRNTPHAAQRPQLETIQSTRSLTSTRASPSKQPSKRKKPTKPKRLSGAGSPVGDDTD